MGEAAEAVGEQEPGFAGQQGGLVRRESGRKSLGAEPDKLRPTRLVGHVSAHGAAEPAENGG